MGITITEALAEIKTVGKRLEKKREFVRGYLYRQDALKDPFEKDGGSVQLVARERQGIADLESRVVTLRREIQRANDQNTITIGTETRSIADWLIWRRDVAPGHKEFLGTLAGTLRGLREQAKKTALNVLTAGTAPASPNDVIVNIDEAALAREIEEFEMVMGSLDGQLSLKNATVTIDA